MRILVAAESFEACFVFYREIVGLAPQADTRHGPYAKFSLPGGGAIALQTRAHFASTAQPPRPGAGDHVLLAIRVASVDAEVARLRAAGATVDDPRDLFGRMRAAWLRDPAGTLIELQQW